jgi:hypothetical protein
MKAAAFPVSVCQYRVGHCPVPGVELNSKNRYPTNHLKTPVVQISEMLSAPVSYTPETPYNVQHITDIIKQPFSQTSAQSFLV